MVNRPVLAIVVLWTVAVAIGLGARGFWTPDEPRHAEVAREMAHDGHWLQPHLHGEPYPDKPPLFFWMIAALAAVFGPDPLAMRVPTALASLGCALTMFAFARRMYGPRPALASAVVLLTGGEFVWLSQRVDMNVWVTWCVLGAVACGAIAVQEDRRGLWAVVFLLTGFGLILKGPVVVLMILLVLIPWIVVGHGGATLRRVPWWMAPLALVGPVAWAAPLWLTGRGDYLQEMLFGHGFGMAVGVGSHDEPVHYYLTAFPAAALPWIVFLPWAWVKLWRDPISKSRRWLPILWIVLPLVALSFAGAKRSLYLLPAWPGVALAVGYLLAESPRPPRVPASIVAALMGAVAAGLVLLEHRFLPPGAWAGWAMGAALAGGAALVLRGRVLRGVAVGMALALLAFRWDAAPRVDPWMGGGLLAGYLREQNLAPSHSVGWDPAQIELQSGAVILEVAREGDLPPDATCALARIGGRGWSDEDIAAAGFHRRATFCIERREIAVLTRAPFDAPYDEPAPPAWVAKTRDRDVMGAIREAPTDRMIGAAALAAVVLAAAVRRGRGT